MTERVAVVAWAGGEVRGEVLAHRDLAAEARAAGHLGEGVVGEFEEFLGGGDALGDEPVQGVVPVVAWKWRAKERGDMPARAASVATVWGSSRRARAWARTSARASASRSARGWGAR